MAHHIAGEGRIVSGRKAGDFIGMPFADSQSSRITLSPCICQEDYENKNMYYPLDYVARFLEKQAGPELIVIGPRK